MPGQEDEKEQARRSAAVDKERKDLEKEESRRKKENDRESKERQRLEEIQSKEKNKLILKFSKEKRKSESVDRNKIRAVYRKDFTADLKRIRGEANASVLQYFDQEETLQEQVEHTKISRVSTEEEDRSCTEEQSPLDEFFESIPSCDSIFLRTSSSSSSSSLPSVPSTVREIVPKVLKTIPNGLSFISNDLQSTAILTQQNDDDKDRIEGVGESVESISRSEVIWDDVFQTANCLNVFNNFLQLQMPLKLDILVSKVAKVTQAGIACHVRKFQHVKNEKNSVSGSGIDSVDMIVKDRGERVGVQSDTMALNSRNTISDSSSCGNNISDSSGAISSSNDSSSSSTGVEVKEEMDTDELVKMDEDIKVDPGFTASIEETACKYKDSFLESIKPEEVEDGTIKEDTGKKIGLTAELNAEESSAPSSVTEIPMEIDGECSVPEGTSDPEEVRLLFIQFLISCVIMCVYVCACVVLSRRLSQSFLHFFPSICALFAIPFLSLFCFIFPISFLPTHSSAESSELFTLSFFYHIFLTFPSFSYSLTYLSTPIIPLIPLHPPALLYALSYPNLTFILIVIFTFILTFIFTFLPSQSFDLPALLEALADLDRIHLCLVSSLTADLHSLLDLGTQPTTDMLAHELSPCHLHLFLFII